MSITIIIVDDHTLFRKGLRSILEDAQDLRVIDEADNGQEAINLVKSLSPDVVIMDISMPEMTGVEATRHILDKHPGTKIIALSVHSTRQYIEDMLRVGASGYILKGDDPKKLIAGIRAVMRGEIYLTSSVTGVVVSEIVNQGSEGRPSSMEGEEKIQANHIFAIKRTKLHRPHVSKELIPREQLVDILQNGRHRPFTLISAPAGYGKSTLASYWLETNPSPSAWYSLDGDDNDLRLFLSYLIRALQPISPGVGRETLMLLKASDLPSMEITTRILVNDLDQIKNHFILVLDDYHNIRESVVHGLIEGLLVHPPANMHLLIITRRDPPISLVSQRARGNFTEIREQDLRFSLEETGRFLQQSMQIAVSDKIVSILEEKTEGWVVALQLAALSMREQADMDQMLEDLPASNSYVMDYIVSEVLSRESSEVQKFLLSTAVLNRFNAKLCETMYTVGSGNETCSISGKEFIARLEIANLFVIPLDSDKQWFRYHHLFQELLIRLLKSRFSQSTVDALHLQATKWYADKGLIEEALQHAIVGQDIKMAIGLFVTHRHDLMNRDQWHQLERWLRMFPNDYVERHPVLLLSRAWLNYYLWYTLGALVSDLQKAEGLMLGEISDDDGVTQMTNEIAALQGGLLYWVTNGTEAVKKSKQVLDSTPSEHECVRSTAMYHMGGGYQLLGDHLKAEKMIWDGLKDAAYQHPSSHARMMTALCFNYWCEADLRHTFETAEQLLKISQKNNLPVSASFARYFLGAVHYDYNELEAAAKQLEPIVDKSYLYPFQNYAHSAFLLGLTYLVQARQEEAFGISKTISNIAFQKRNTLFKQTGDAFQAELDLRQGWMAEASHWATQFQPGKLQSMHRYFVPHLTWVKVILFCGISDNYQKADTFLKRLYDFQKSAHNTKRLIDILLLQSILYELLGDETVAFEKLDQALKLAEPARFIRPFLDMGPKMANLLNRLATRKTDIKYVGKLMKAFRNETIAGEPTKSLRPDTAKDVKRVQLDIIEAMTKRELEITTLLVQRLSNKEIAEKLFISPETVKRHLYNIFQKLNVSTRREAADKASALDLV